MCLQAVTLENLRCRMLTSWRNQLGRVGGTDLGVPEDALGHVLDDLGRALAWPRTWAQLRADLATAGIGSPAAADADTLGLLRMSAPGRATRSGCRNSPAQSTASTSGSALEPSPLPLPLWNLFADALLRQDLAQWHRLREELKDLHEIAPGRTPAAELRRACPPAPRSGPPGSWPTQGRPEIPVEFDAAWQWRQLDSWVRKLSPGRPRHRSRPGSRNSPGTAARSRRPRQRARLAPPGRQPRRPAAAGAQ